MSKITREKNSHIVPENKQIIMHLVEFTPDFNASLVISTSLKKLKHSINIAWWPSSMLITVTVSVKNRGVSTISYNSNAMKRRISDAPLLTSSAVNVLPRKQVTAHYFQSICLFTPLLYI